MALKIVKLKTKPGLAIAGPLASGGMYTHYNLHLAAALQALGTYELGLFADEAVAEIDEPALRPTFGRLPRDLRYQIEHRTLPVMQPPARGHWILAQPWEYGSLPVDWLPLFRYSADEIWVHTRSNLQAYLREGVDAERLVLMPSGVDPGCFLPAGPRLELPEARPFRFLFVGESLWYSGLDVLIQAFYDEFLPDEPVSLVVLEWTEAPLASRQATLDKLRELQQQPDCPPIHYLDRHMGDAERAALYRACQAFVYPCRADAFATPVIEAAACGLPLILTELEGRFDLPDSDRISWLSARLARQAEARVGGLATLNQPVWSDVNPIELRQRLRACYEQRDRLAADPALVEHVHAHFAWRTLAGQVQTRLESLASRPIFRHEQDRLQEETLRGLEAMEAGDNERALALLREVQAQIPEDPMVLLDLAGLQLQRGEYAEALTPIEKALPLAPRHPNLYHAAGIALYHLDAWELAARYFRRTLQLQPDHQGAFESLAPAQERAGGEGDRSGTFSGLQAWLLGLPEAKARPTISLCMIVKNEELFLRQCLESVKTVVDEIVIVDTGSTDATREIALEFGARVFDFDWNESFSDARNAALEQATGDWILVMDADEVLAPETASNLAQLIAGPLPVQTGFLIKIRNLHSEGNQVDVVEHYMMRFFPNDAGLRFRGVIHEQLQPVDDRPFDRMATPDVLLLHYGYIGKTMEDRDKYRRNLDLLRASIEREPENPFHWFNLGLTHRIQREEDDALAAFEKAVELSRKLDYLPAYMAACYSYIASLLIERGAFQQALDICEQAPLDCQENPDYWVNLGSIWNGLGDYNQAIAAFEKAMSMRSAAFTAVVSDRAATTWKPYAGIGNTYLAQNKLDQADYYFRRALKENAHNPEILLGLGRLALLREQIEQATFYFQRLLEHPQAGEMRYSGRYELARAHLLKQETEVAQSLLEALLSEPVSESLRTTVRTELSQIYLRQNRVLEATQMLEGITDSEALIQALALFYQQQGAHQKLAEMFSELIAKAERPQAEHYKHRGAAYLYLEQYDAAEADFRQALALTPEDAQIIHNLGVIALQRDDLAEARRCFETALAHDPKLFESLLDLGKLDIYEQRPQAARVHLQAAHALQPRHRELLETLAFVYYSLGQSAEASGLYLDLIELHPRHTEAMIQLGYILNEAGENGRALQLFERALDLGADSLVLYNGIGLAFLQLARYTDARNAFLLALQRDPDNAELQRAVTLADQLCGQAPLATS